MGYGRKDFWNSGIDTVKTALDTGLSIRDLIRNVILSTEQVTVCSTVFEDMVVYKVSSITSIPGVLHGLSFCFGNN